MYWMSIYFLSFFYLRCISVSVCSTSLSLITLIGCRVERFSEPVTGSSSTSFSYTPGGWLQCWQVIHVNSQAHACCTPRLLFDFMRLCVACEKFVDGNPPLVCRIQPWASLNYVWCLKAKFSCLSWGLNIHFRNPCSEQSFSVLQHAGRLCWARQGGITRTCDSRLPPPTHFAQTVRLPPLQLRQVSWKPSESACSNIGIKVFAYVRVRNRKKKKFEREAQEVCVCACVFIC